HPSPNALAQHLIELITHTNTSTPLLSDYAKQIQDLIMSIPANNLAQANVLDFLRKLLPENSGAVFSAEKEPNLANMSVDDLVAIALNSSDVKSAENSRDAK
ncbi:hypothetical protein, partial [Mycobacterium kansasii]|uniref:hypothetical protein n=1 Tax=Mycobacterium kansasii TaxID=1768 RepID=UPI0015D4D4C6